MAQVHLGKTLALWLNWGLSLVFLYVIWRMVFSPEPNHVHHLNEPNNTIIWGEAICCTVVLSAAAYYLLKEGL